jgi:hypothetical protein
LSIIIITLVELAGRYWFQSQVRSLFIREKEKVMLLNFCLRDGFIKKLIGDKSWETNFCQFCVKTSLVHKSKNESWVACNSPSEDTFNCGGNYWNSGELTVIIWFNSINKVL